MNVDNKARPKKAKKLSKKAGPFNCTVRRVRAGLKGHPGTAWMLFFMGGGFLAGSKEGLVTALGGVGVMVVFFGPIYLWGAYSRGKANESA